MIRSPSRVVPQSAVVGSFDRRSRIFERESTWAVDNALNHLCAEMILHGLPARRDRAKVLDYGAGPGTLARVLADTGVRVDVADISAKMLRKCRFANRRYLLPKDKIRGLYDRIVLRQVLQYVYAEEWDAFVVRLLSRLRPCGRLLFSEIVPYCDADRDFWRGMVRLRRKARRSFPTESEFLRLCEANKVPVLQVTYSQTRQSLAAWLCGASPRLAASIVERYRGASDSVRALWDIRRQSNGDTTWTNRWVHILVGTPPAA